MIYPGPFGLWAVLGLGQIGKMEVEFAAEFRKDLQRILNGQYIYHIYLFIYYNI